MHQCKLVFPDRAKNLLVTTRPTSCKIGRLPLPWRHRGSSMTSKMPSKMSISAFWRMPRNVSMPCCVRQSLNVSYFRGTPPLQVPSVTPCTNLELWPFSKTRCALSHCTRSAIRHSRPRPISPTKSFVNFRSASIMSCLSMKSSMRIQYSTTVCESCRLSYCITCLPVG